MAVSQDNSKRDVNLLKKETSQGKAGDLSSPIERRRTFLKGAAAIPIVMTLPSGAMAAMSSSSLACVARDRRFAAATQPAVITSNKDTWVRKAVTAKEIQKKGSSASSFKVYQLNSTPGDSNNWLDQAGNRYYADEGSSGSMKMAGDLTESAYSAMGAGETQMYIIAQVNDRGEIIGFGESLQYNYITASCYTSVNPLAGMV